MGESKKIIIGLFLQLEDYFVCKLLSYPKIYILQN